MLQAHFDELERLLLARARVPAHAGHPLHKGTPREVFIREFLETHLGEKVAIGTGEIFDAESRPRQSRNQIDIVLYKRDFPKISFGGGINGFFAESVVATIEVKSVLTAAEVVPAVRASRRLKRLRRHLDTSFTTGYIPPGILSYVVAYDGPKKMQTAQAWIRRAEKQLRLKTPILGPRGAGRYKVAAGSLDGVFVLGRGFAHFDNSPLGFAPQVLRDANPERTWVLADGPDGNLLFLFLLLMQAASGLAAASLDPIPYLRCFQKPILLR
jgi:hypothetical protein